MISTLVVSLLDITSFPVEFFIIRWTVIACVLELDAVVTIWHLLISCFISFISITIIDKPGFYHVIFSSLSLISMLTTLTMINIISLSVLSYFGYFYQILNHSY